MIDWKFNFLLYWIREFMDCPMRCIHSRQVCKQSEKPILSSGSAWVPHHRCDRKIHKLRTAAHVRLRYKNTSQQYIPLSNWSICTSHMNTQICSIENMRGERGCTTKSNNRSRYRKQRPSHQYKDGSWYSHAHLWKCVFDLLNSISDDEKFTFSSFELLLLTSDASCCS